jgi:hypothetical protein
MSGVEGPQPEYWRAVMIDPNGREWALPISKPNDEVKTYRSQAESTIHIASLGGRREKGYTFRLETLTVTGSEPA